MTAVVEAAAVDHAVGWLERTVECGCLASEGHTEDCPLLVGIRLLREARRFTAFEPPL